MGERIDRDGAAEPAEEDRLPLRLQIGFEGVQRRGERQRWKEASVGVGDAGDGSNGFETGRNEAAVSFWEEVSEFEVVEGRGVGVTNWRVYLN